VIITLKLKLLPTLEQKKLLIETIREANAVCSAISEVAFEKRIFNNFKLHHEVYHSYKSSFKISSQVLVRCISRVSDSFKVARKSKKRFNPLGAIDYDSRIISYKSDSIVSIWAIGGRIKMPFVCHDKKYFSYNKKDAKLIFKNEKFYIFQSIEILDNHLKDVEEFIGVDMGLIEIAALSNGKTFSSEKLTKYREKRQKIRSSVQSKRTRGGKKLLKRLSGRERTTASIINHTIAKQIVQIAKEERKGIAIEDLKGIQLSSIKKGKKFRARVGKWSFGQLRKYISYKAALVGIPVISVNPRYTSKTCSKCHYIGNRKGKTFQCNNCGNNMDADVNASINIATLGASVNKPENSIIYSCALYN
jgi:IS605 OrfB family transposase